MICKPQCPRGGSAQEPIDARQSPRSHGGALYPQPLGRPGLNARATPADKRFEETRLGTGGRPHADQQRPNERGNKGMGHDASPVPTRDVIAHSGRRESGLHGYLHFLDSRQGFADPGRRSADQGRNFHRFPCARQGVHIAPGHTVGSARGVQQASRILKRRLLLGPGTEFREQFRSGDSGRVLLNNGGRQKLLGKRGRLGRNVYRICSECSRSQRQRIERAVGGEQFEYRAGCARLRAVAP